MYTKEPRLIGEKENLSNYVEGVDVYNSLFLHILADPNINKLPYQITVHEYRPDLIAKDIYGSTSYMGILMAQIGIGLDQLTRGTVLFVLSKETIDALIKNI